MAGFASKNSDYSKYCNSDIPYLFLKIVVLSTLFLCFSTIIATSSQSDLPLEFPLLFRVNFSIHTSKKHRIATSLHSVDIRREDRFRWCVWIEVVLLLFLQFYVSSLFLFFCKEISLFIFLNVKNIFS